MSPKIDTQLKDLNFTDKEQVVYLAILKLGQGSVVEIAKEAKVERTTTARVLTNLETKGLLTRVPAGKRLEWQALHPRHLDDLIKKQQLAASTIIPELAAIFSRKEEMPKISYYEGHDALKQLNLDMIEEAKYRSEILSFSSPGAFFPSLTKTEWDKLVKKRISKQILSKLLMPDLGGAPGYTQGEDWKNWRIVKLVDPTKFPFKVTFNVIADKVSIMAVRRKIPIALVIDDREVTETFRMIFAICWNSINTDPNPRMRSESTNASNN